MSDWPPHVHTNDPETAQDSAEQLDPTRDVQAIVQFMADNDREQGWTMYEMKCVSEVLNAMDERNNGLQKRITDAFYRGLIDEMRDGDGWLHRRKSQFNRDQRVLRVTGAGRDWLASGTKLTTIRRPSRRQLSDAERNSIHRLYAEAWPRQPLDWVLVRADDLHKLLQLLQRLGVWR